LLRYIVLYCIPGVHASEKVRLYALLSPAGPYYKSGFAPIKLLADTKNIRAWPGGVGNAKVSKQLQHGKISNFNMVYVTNTNYVLFVIC
jgi:branched-subunit amino acid aminotransferase/4-amino-4-deoxychorismate lyase